MNFDIITRHKLLAEASPRNYRIELKKKRGSTGVRQTKHKGWWESICAKGHKVIVENKYATYRPCRVCASKAK